MANSYDEVLYEGRPFVQTHPDRLATVGRLFGMQPAPIDRCRVLELGCGDGGNLIPMAYTLPGSEFVGIDAGARGIAIGQENAAAMGLANLHLRHLDMLDTTVELGRFDYIISHGVYSWVPPAVQDRLLEIGRENLNPQGIVYVSYSAYPGSHTKIMLAEMMKYHARRFEDPEQQIEQARALVLFLSTARTNPDAYTALLKEEVETLARRHPRTIYHDELGEYLEPLYFREFAERASRRGLQYLGEANFFEMNDHFSDQPEVAAMLQSLARDQIDREQYMDFVKCRRFRQTLLCHAEVSLNRQVESAKMREFRIRIGGDADRILMPTEHPAAKAAVAVLREESPAALAFEALLAAVRTRLGTAPGDDRLLADILLACYARGIVQLYSHPPHFTMRPGELPRASALARRQAAGDVYVTSLSHEVVEIEDELGRRLIRLLDGERSRDRILEEMRAAAPDAEMEHVERGIEYLARLALLEQ
jgi:methyltransferase-like protein/SAM-dependent methyltransferase